MSFQVKNVATIPQNNSKQNLHRVIRKRVRTLNSRSSSRNKILGSNIDSLTLVQDESSIIGTCNLLSKHSSVTNAGYESSSSLMLSKSKFWRLPITSQKMIQNTRNVPVAHHQTPSLPTIVQGRQNSRPKKPVFQSYRHLKGALSLHKRLGHKLKREGSGKFFN